MAFRVGQKVVYVGAPDGLEPYDNQDLPDLVKREVYVVRDYDTRAVHWHGTATVRLEEIYAPAEPSRLGPWEPGYCETCFRPVQERKQSTETGMSILRGLLKTKKIPETTTSHHSERAISTQAAEQGE